MNLFRFWKQDALASLVVFLVALPLCLGIALASNAPMSSGLLAGIIGGVVVGFFTGSKISVSGPAAGLTVIVAKAITDLGVFEAFTLAVFLSGIFQLLFCVIRAGAVGYFFPSSVIKGMLAAIGIILIMKQVPVLGFGPGFQSIHVGSLIVSTIAILIMLGWDHRLIKGNRILRLIPGALIAVVVSVILNEVFKTGFADLVITEKNLVNIPFSGGFKEFFFTLKAPDWSYLTNAKVYAAALTIAVVGSLESLLSIDAADKMDKDSGITSKNRELLAQGLGNTLSGLVGGLPITAVIVRTTANATAGGKTNLSAILHGLWLLLCVVTIPHVLNLIPLSCLAAVLILVGFKLVKPSLIQGMFKKGLEQFIPFVVTIIAIVATDLLKGIFIGMIVAFIFILRYRFKEKLALTQSGSEYQIRFNRDVTFLQKKSLVDLLETVPAGGVVVIDRSGCDHIDEDINEIISDFTGRAKYKQIAVRFKERVS
ncbi:MAG TPA: SulP family inorganic anion transporter [Bacteriovoracaceae bacterium]|nr:SulP family inorganic anion transporter [Bacteriovoracaceae bacterium]